MLELDELALTVVLDVEGVAGGGAQDGFGGISLIDVT
jgi:hypothetical protein